MGGAPITIICYKNGVHSSGQWLDDPHITARIQALAEEGGETLVEDVVWNNREPWVSRLARDWPAIDSLRVQLRLEAVYTPGLFPV